jgi:hypothetical protein
VFFESPLLLDFVMGSPSPVRGDPWDLAGCAAGPDPTVPEPAQHRPL